jgi:transposase
VDYSSGRKTLDSYLRQLVEIRKQLADINRQIREMSRSEYYREKVRLLNTIPGIGKISTMIWLTELIDIKRFKKFDHLCSYVGIVPGEHSSGEKHITTEMDHRGNRVLRTLLIENSWAALRKDTALMMKYAELTKRMTGNRAIIRIARKLLNRIRYVLINEREYEIRKVN